MSDAAKATHNIDRIIGMGMQAKVDGRVTHQGEIIDVFPSGSDASGYLALVQMLDLETGEKTRLQLISIPSIVLSNRVVLFVSVDAMKAHYRDVDKKYEEAEEARKILMADALASCSKRPSAQPVPPWWRFWT